MKRIAILGSTGSIGCSALSVVEAHAGRLQVVGLAAGENIGLFVGQVERFRPRAIALASARALAAARGALSTPNDAGIDVVGVGREGLIAVATYPEVDLVLCASSGTAALDAVLAAIEAGKSIALANKEVLVMAGRLVMQAAKRRGVSILPVDSEHNAIHQCLHGRGADELKRLILTASGGPFRGWAVGTLDEVTPQDALHHPTWNMGPKITIDSSTLMNKGLEVIEAHWLFGVPADSIDVVVHPQSIVHSMVELRDGSVIAQLGVTDMRLPIQYAFSYPERWGRGAVLAGSRHVRTSGVLPAGSGPLSLPRAGLPSAAGRGGLAGGAQCDQRGGGRGVSRKASGVHRHPEGHRAGSGCARSVWRECRQHAGGGARGGSVGQGVFPGSHTRVTIKVSGQPPASRRRQQLRVEGQRSW